MGTPNREQLGCLIESGIETKSIRMLSVTTCRNKVAAIPAEYQKGADKLISSRLINAGEFMDNLLAEQLVLL